MRVENKLHLDRGHHREAMPEDRKGVALHRIGGPFLPEVVDAETAVAFFEANPEYTGGQFPYNIIVRQDGIAEQVLELCEVGPHARRWNVPAIGVAFVGDFTVHEPSLVQRDNGIFLVAAICAWIGDYFCRAHDDLPGGSSDPRKQCPGRHFDVGGFRKDVAREVAQLRSEYMGPNPALAFERNLIEMGVTI